MASHRTQQTDRQGADALIRRLHRVVTRGPGDLDIVAAMRPHGCDEMWWATGECALAALIDAPEAATVAAAQAWYDEAVRAARKAFVGSPLLLARLGLRHARSDYN